MHWWYRRRIEKQMVLAVDAGFTVKHVRAFLADIYALKVEYVMALILGSSLTKWKEGEMGASSTLRQIASQDFVHLMTLGGVTPKYNGAPA